MELSRQLHLVRSHQWMVVESESMSHILPMDDIFPHVESKKCICHPMKEGKIIVHNAFDDREAYEPGQGRLFG